MFTRMTTKTLTITEEAYERLRARKSGDESFSELIIRITHRRPLADFAGILEGESGSALKKAVEDSRRERQAVDARRRRRA